MYGDGRSLVDSQDDDCSNGCAARICQESGSRRFLVPTPSGAVIVVFAPHQSSVARNWTVVKERMVKFVQSGI
ncbi:hypothetical protein ACFX2I_031832 [Malus domestica]